MEVVEELVAPDNQCKTELHSLCRVCLNSDDNKISIFSESGHKIALQIKLHRFLAMTVQPDDSWPLSVCLKCVQKIEDINSLYELSLKNELILKSWVGANRLEDSIFEQVLIEPDVKYDLALVKEEMSMAEDKQVPPTVVNFDDENFEKEEPTEEEPDNYSSSGSDSDSDDDEEEGEVPKKEKSSKSKSKKRKRRNEDDLKVSGSRQRLKDDEMIRSTIVIDCVECFENFPTFDELMSHMRIKHNEPNGYLKCCDKKFKRRYVLLEHVRLHINPDAYACEICKKRFSTKRHLNDHTVLHIPEDQREFQCEKCLKRYSTSYRLALHMKSHNEELSFKCPHCDKGFRQQVVLKGHIKSVHEMSNAHICEICAKVFKTKEGFITHQDEHLVVRPSKLQCEICGGKYKNRDSLKYHMLRHKRAHERYYCDICNKEFNCKKRMRAHRKYVHAEKKLKCTLCEKEFKRPICLKEHMASHTGQILYTCAYCPKQFNSNANKYSHQKAQHPIEWETARSKRKME